MKKLWSDLRVLLGLCGLMALVHLANIYTGYSLLQYGLIPRQVDKLYHVFSAPFLHISSYHLLNNLFGLVLFGSLCLVRSKRFFVNSSLFIILVSGVLVWAFGRGSIHIGASGWVFGLWSLCIAMALVEKSAFNILVAVFVILFYGGMIYGVLPSDSRVSFEYHLFGTISGVLCAFTLHKNRKYQRSGS